MSHGKWRETKQSQVGQSHQLLLSFPPFPVRHPVRSPCISHSFVRIAWRSDFDSASELKSFFILFSRSFWPKHKYHKENQLYASYLERVIVSGLARKTTIVTYILHLHWRTRAKYCGIIGNKSSVALLSWKLYDTSRNSDTLFGLLSSFPMAIKSYHTSRVS